MVGRSVRVLACAALVACASAGGAAPSTEQTRVVATGPSGEMVRTNNDMIDVMTLPMSIDAAFSAMTAAYIKIGIDIKDNDPVQHIVGNHRFSVNGSIMHRPLSQFLNCGAGAVGLPRADTYQLVVTVVSRLTADPDGETNVQTVVNAQATEPTSSSGSVYCSSTGRLERELIRVATPKGSS